MDFAIPKEKNPEAAWRKIVSHSKRVRKSQILKKPIPLLKSKMDTSQVTEWPWARTISEIAWMTLFLFGLAQGYLFFTRSSYWAVSDVRLYGNHILSEEELYLWTGPIQGENIFKLNLSSLARRLDQHPWVQQVSVERKLPDTIQVNIKERTPIARVRLNKIYVVDNFGVLLKEDTSKFSSLPLIHGLDDSEKKPGDWIIHESLASSLKMMHYLNQLAFFQSDPVHEVRIQSLNRAVFTTKENLTQIRMNLENPKETFEKLKAVLSLDGFSYTAYEYIDLSFRNQVVVKPVSAGDTAFHRS